MRDFSQMGIRFTSILMVCLGLLLSSCGGGDASQSKDSDQAELSAGVSPIITNKGFGQPGSAAEIAAAAKLQSSYFDGRLAGTAGGLTGSTVAPNGASSLTKAMLQTSSVPQQVHRFYNTATGVHFYTLSEEEKTYVQANLPSFQYEGPARYSAFTTG